MHKAAAITVLPFFLAACGGGGGGSSSDSGNLSGSAATLASSVTLSGVVTDGPIVGAQVCLFSDGLQARNMAGGAICSAETDAQGNYTITIPRDLAPGFLTLVASKDGNIRLASALGTLARVLDAAGNSATLTSTNFPAARITHFTTADFALADTNNDGTVSKGELDLYRPDYTRTRPVATVVKAVIDFGSSPSLLGAEVNNTLLLASAAARNQALGTTGKTAGQWTADPANANVVATVDQDVANEMAVGFSDYQLSTVVTSSRIPSGVTANNATGGTASLGCEINTSNESVIVKIALDASRGVIVINHDNIQTVGSYNRETGAVAIDAIDPFAVSIIASGVTYYAEGYFKLNGTINASNGKITGTYSELSANTWSLDSARQECAAAGTLTATKL